MADLCKDWDSPTLPCPALPLPSIPDPTWALRRGMLTTAVAASTLWPSCHIWEISHQEDKSFSCTVTAQGRSCCCCGGAALICSPALGSCAAQLDALLAPNQNMPVKVQLSCPAELQQGQCHREARAEPVCLGSSAGSRGLARPSLLRSCEQGH